MSAVERITRPVMVESSHGKRFGVMTGVTGPLIELARMGIVTFMARTTVLPINLELVTSAVRRYIVVAGRTRDGLVSACQCERCLPVVALDAI